jgi:hypothetical protein
LIVASLYKTISWAIFTVSADDIVKDLTCWADRHIRRWKKAYRPGGTKLDRHWDVPPQMIHYRYLVYLYMSQGKWALS